MNRFLVTGGLGFLGSSLVRSLVRDGHAVRTIDNSLRGSKERLGEVVHDVELIEGDIRDPSVVNEAVKGVDTVIHMAFVNGTKYFYEQPAFVLDVGVKGLVHVIDSCIRQEVKDFIVASSSEVYQTPPVVPTPESVPLSIPDPLNPRYSYGGGKILTELMALNYSPYFDRVVVFRPHNVYGPAMGWEHVIPEFVERMKSLVSEQKGGKMEFPIQGSGEQTRAFIYIEDFTEALRLIVEKGGNREIYHIGTMEERTIKDVAYSVAKHMGIDISILPGKEPLGGTPRRCPDTTKLQSLGFQPKYSLDEGLKPTVEWYAGHEKPEALPLKAFDLSIPKLS